MKALIGSLCLLALPATSIFAQQQPAGPPRTSPSASAPSARSNYYVPKRKSFAEVPAPHSSLLRQRPWHEDFVPESQPGFRNPNGVGRMVEYYPPGDKFQNDSPRHITARIGLGGVPDRNEQLAAQQTGTAYYGMLMNHIDRYGSPMMGFGMGFGWGW